MSDMKKWELVVEANSFDGSQTFACEAETKEDALAKFKSGLCEIIEVNIEVIGLDEEPIDIEESTCIQSRLSQDVISRMAEEIAELKKFVGMIGGLDIHQANDRSFIYTKMPGEAKQLLAKLNPDTMK